MAEVLDRIDNWLQRLEQKKRVSEVAPIARLVLARAEEWNQKYENGDLLRHSQKLMRDFMVEPHSAALRDEEILALACVAIKKTLGFLPNEIQVSAAILLTKGTIVELRTGEGKTIVAAVAAYSQAVRGRHVDIATTNDYLAERDQRWMALIYRLLGISVGVVTSKTPRPERKAQYKQMITYAANQELAFDYLRDHLVTSPEEAAISSLDFVIIDEVDSVLIDEARTPLIISERVQAKKVDESLPREFVPAIHQLEEEIDFTIDYRHGAVAFTDWGISKLADILHKDYFALGDFSAIRLLWYLLYTRMFLKPERDFIVKEKKIVLVDEFTGHAMPDRRFLDGLQQALELAADIPQSTEDVIAASITYKNFFRLYKTIAGMTGTAYKAKEEFRMHYGLDVVALEPFHGIQRRDLETVFFKTQKEKMRSVAQEAMRARDQKVPVLIVSRSIELTKAVSRELSRLSIPHNMLHADVAQSEAEIIERAGHPGTVTVATNMAGRGADIVIDESLRLSYGLRVLGVEHNRSSRIDEQLRGRSGRQGQFGETRFFASLEDELLYVYADEEFWKHAERVVWSEKGVLDLRLEDGVRRAQKAAEKFDEESRSSLAEFDAFVDRHRSAIYTFRDRLIRSARFYTVLFNELRNILLSEEKSKANLDDIRVVLDYAKVPERRRRLVDEQFFRGNDGDNPPVSGELRLAVLREIDESWEHYLENIGWLEDWISIVSVSQQNPYVEFAQTADRMFHDMRRELAISVLKDVCKIP